MKNKRTTIIFTDEANAESAQAIKDYLASDANNLTIIIGEDEFRGIAFKLVTDRLFKDDGNVRRIAEKVRRQISGLTIDKLRSEEIKFNSKKTSHVKAYNILIRYTPDLIILNDETVIDAVLAARDKALPNVPVIMVVSNFALNLKIANQKINKFFVENMTIKTTLVNNNIPESDIIVADFPINPAFDNDVNKNAIYDEFRFSYDKPLVVFSTPALDTESVTSSLYALQTLMQLSRSLNIILDCGRNRNMLSFAQSHSLPAINEGRSSHALYRLADIVIGRPIPISIAKTLYAGNIYFMLEPKGIYEQRTASYFSNGVIVPTYDKQTLEAQLHAYIDNPKSFDNVRELIKDYHSSRPRGILFKNIDLMLDIKQLS
ncbi:MAG: hypothetical protein LBE09_03075 [Christensenellaceae bacterium]|jgi:hypothetical protein|nr:hypothetical protein [Christensenellaceae bacterium]